MVEALCNMYLMYCNMYHAMIIELISVNININICNIFTLLQMANMQVSVTGDVEIIFIYSG